MTCPKCGAPLPDNHTFCMACGTKRTVAEDATMMMGGSTADADATLAAPAAAAPRPDDATVAMSAEEAEAFRIEDPLFRSVREALGESYEVKRELGRGGMAVVYEAIERDLHRRVAIKVLPPDMAAGDNAERFKREARLAASLDHANIIPVYRVGQAGSLQYMAMKFVEGRPLDEIVKDQGALPIPVALRILTDAARGLAFAHERKVIHRDIKGANILIEKDGRVIVSDFGIARAVGEHTLTATGMVVGTPSYMSPEQCGGLELGPQSDQYSLGILAFQLLTGKLPFEADSLIELLQHHYMTPPPDIRQIRDDVPNELVAVIIRALQKKADQRFPTTKHMVAAFERVPLTTEERDEAERQLIQLITGERVSRVSVGDMPPLTTPMETALARTAVAPPPAPAPASKAPWVVLVLVLVLGGGGAGVAWQMGLLNGAAPATSPAAQVPARPQPVILRFAGLPPNAQIMVDGKPHSASGQDVEPGPRSILITADGYDMWRETARVDADTTITVAMTPIRQQRADPQPTPPAPRPVERGELLVRVTDAATNRVVTAATILLDGQERVENGRTSTVAVGNNRRLSVTASGCTRKDTTITVTSGSQTRVVLKLTCQG